MWFVLLLVSHFPYLHSSIEFKLQRKKICVTIYVDNMLEYDPMITVIRFRVSKIQFNSLIIISLDAFVYFLSFVYSFTSFWETKTEKKIHQQLWNEQQMANVLQTKDWIPKRDGKTNVAANFIIFCKNKCSELWQFNEIICFSLVLLNFWLNFVFLLLAQAPTLASAYIALWKLRFLEKRKSWPSFNGCTKHGNRYLIS